MDLRTQAPVATTPGDIEAMFQMLRRSLLMQVRWIEDHPPLDAQTNEFLTVIRRSNLQLVRTIETSYNIASRHRKVKSKRKNVDKSHFSRDGQARRRA